jgi:hypothetical protein
MNETEFVEPTGDSFWEIGQFKKTIKRVEDGYKVCNDMIQLITERADIEKNYSKNLKTWSKKWNDYLQKGSEYGTMKTTWNASLTEADRLADIHLKTHNVLNEDLTASIKAWQKQNFSKTLVNQIKISKDYEEEFKKAQKPWAKKYELVQKTKKEYHAACKSYQSAKVQDGNAKNDSAISPDQKKKLEDKVEKYKKEVESTKHKYKQALEELNTYNSRYIEDMNVVYKKCDQFEKTRLDFFIQRFEELQSHLNIYEKMNIEDIYTDFLKTIKQSNPNKDLAEWSKDNGSGMAMNWPVFEEYSEELKTIARGTRATKLTKDMNADNNGVTMTSMKLKNDESGETFSASAASEAGQRNDSIKMTSKANTSSNNHSNSNNSKESVSNPFGEFDDDEDSNNNNSNLNNNRQSNQHPANSDSDDDSSIRNQPNGKPASYLSVKVKALYDYISAEDDELSFKAGEEFTKLASEDERGWCLGQIGSKTGLYPATYANEI